MLDFLLIIFGVGICFLFVWAGLKLCALADRLDDE